MPNFESPKPLEMPVEPALNRKLEQEQLDLEQQTVQVQADKKQINLKIRQLFNLGYTSVMIIGLLSSVLDKAQAEEIVIGQRSEGDKTEMVENNKPEVQAEPWLESEKPELNFDDQADDLIAECQNFINSHEFLREKPASAVAWVSAIEKPTDYQVKQIMDLVKQTAENIAGQSFNSFNDQLVKINNLLDADLTDDQISVFLKDAFPAKEGDMAKGTLDCDSRSILIQSVLELNNEGDKIRLVNFVGHMVIYNIEDNSFFEATTNNNYQLENLDPDLIAQINIINNLKQFLSFNLSNKAAYYSDENRSFFKAMLGGASAEKDGRQDPIQLNRLALHLDSGNLNAFLNLTTEGRWNKELANEILSNYARVITEAAQRVTDVGGQPLINREIHEEIPKLDQSNNDSDFLEAAIEKSRFIENAARDFADKLADNNYNEEACKLYETLIKANGLSSNFMNIAWDKPQLLMTLFKSQEYKKFLHQADQAIDQLDSLIINDFSEYKNFNPETDELEKIKEAADNNAIKSGLESSKRQIKTQKLSARIMSGDLIIKTEDLDYYRDDPVLGPYIKSYHNWNFRDALNKETLENWKGFPALLKTLESSPEVQVDKIIENIDSDPETIKKLNDLKEKINSGDYKVIGIDLRLVDAMELTYKIISGQIEVNDHNFKDFYNQYKNHYFLGRILTKGYHEHSNQFYQVLQQKLNKHFFNKGLYPHILIEEIEAE